MKYITLALVALLSLSLNAQTFPVGKMTLNFKDASRSGGSAGGATILVPTGGTGRSVGADLFYPATTAGGSTAAIGQFPIVVFGHGFVMAASDYTNVANRLASLGYIVAVARTENEGPLPFPTPNHVQFGADLAYLAGAVYALNSTTITSLTSFNNKIINKSAIGGHSMGGGCSFIGAQSNTTITCLFNMAAATSNTASATNSSIAGATLVTVPTLVISGEKDNVADSTVQNSHYNNTASAIKFHTIIKGVTHCDFGNGTSVTCTIGQGACSGAGCNAVLFAKYMAYLEPFLANQLKSDCAAGNAFMALIQNPSTDRVGRKIKGTIACATTGIQSQTEFQGLTVFPNPTQGKINITYATELASPLKFELYDISGRLVLTETSSNTNTSKELNLESIQNGSYILYIYQNEAKKAYKIIKQ